VLVSANTLGSQGEIWFRVDQSEPGASPSLLLVPPGMTGTFESLKQQIADIGQDVTIRRQSTTTSGAWTIRNFQMMESPEQNNPTEIFWQMPVVRVAGGRR
jgi:hypothetical protein